MTGLRRSQLSAARVAIVNLMDAPEHLAQLAEWHHRECVRQGIKSQLSQRRERLQQHMKNPCGVPQTWLALQASSAHLLGCASLVSYQVGRSQHNIVPHEALWLSNLYVLPEYRRQGIASALMTRVLAFSRAQHLPSLWLTATEQTTFYERRGWRIQRRARVSGQWVNVMQRAL